MNVLLTGYFGHRNLGDDLLLVQALKHVPSHCQLYIYWPAGADAEALPFQRIRPFTLVHSWKEALRHRYRLFIYAGGGRFPSRTFGVPSLIHGLLQGLTARHKALNGVGIVPKQPRRWFDLFLRTFDYCSVRDEISRKFVSEIAPNTVNCGDLYWGAPIIDKALCSKNIGEGKKLVVCLANPFSETEKKDVRIQGRYELLVKQISTIIAETKALGYQIHYMPFFMGLDERFISDVQTCLGSHDKILLQGKDYELDTIDQLFASYDAGICMRFHSILLAVKNNVPCLAICYDHKSEQLLQEAGLSEYGIRYGIRTNEFFGEECDMDEARLRQVLERALGDPHPFQSKALPYAQRKHQAVIDNYQQLFRLL